LGEDLVKEGQEVVREDHCSRTSSRANVEEKRTSRCREPAGVRPCLSVSGMSVSIRHNNRQNKSAEEKETSRSCWCPTGDGDEANARRRWNKMGDGDGARWKMVDGDGVRWKTGEMAIQQETGRRHRLTALLHRHPFPISLSGWGTGKMNCL
jgi:hypothetical protein